MIKRLLLLLTLLPAAALAQSGSSGGVRSTGTIAPNDCVKFVSKNVITSNGGPCAAGGGSGTVTSFSAPTGFTVNTATTTPALVMPSGWGVGSLLLGDGAASVSSLAIGATPNFYLTTNGTTASWAQVGLGQINNPAAATSFTYAANQHSAWIFSGSGAFDITGPLTVSGDIAGASVHCGILNTTACVLTGYGSTSGTATLTWPAVAGTLSNPVTFSNSLSVPAAANSVIEFGATMGLAYNTANNNQFILFNNGNYNLAITTAGPLIGGSTVLGFRAADVNGAADIALSSTVAGLLDVGTGAVGSTAGLILSGNKAVLVADFTDSNASGLQAITGLSFALPNVAKNWSFQCNITYSEATPIAGDQFGVASLTTAATNLHAWAHVVTTEGATAAQTTGDSGNITTTTPTSIVTFTPIGTGIKQAELYGSIEVAGTGASTLQFYVTNGTAADVIVVKRDSNCHIY